jgi:hypothetical protein
LGAKEHEVDESLKKAMEANYGGPIKRAIESLIDNPRQKVIDALEKSRPSFAYTLPALRMPDIHIPELPTQEERNEYQSAGFFMRRLADSVIQWRQQLPSDQQPAILAVLNGGIQITVERLAEESFHGIRLEGKIGGIPCMVLAHQGTLQLLCYIEKLEDEGHRRRIGFIIDGKEEQI